MKWYRPKALTGASSQHGVALLIVLWIFIFLSVVAFDFTVGVREEATAAHRYSDENQGYYLALAGFEQGLYEFLTQAAGREQPQTAKPSKDLFDGIWSDATLGNGTYRVRLVDESGKININRVDEETLRRVLINIGIEEPQRSTVIDSIMDWRDADDLHRTNGAENEYYQSLSPAYTAKNGVFDTVEDLLWVRGVTPALFYGSEVDHRSRSESKRVGLREIFTVDSPIDRVNLRTATAQVIYAMVGIPLEKCLLFVDERKKVQDKTLADLLPLLGIGAGDAALQSFIFSNPTVISIEAQGSPADSRQSRLLRGVIRAGGNRGFEVIRWIDREIALPQ
jgi:general secretion pathway protein K